jgi:hypothetical protein
LFSNALFDITEIHFHIFNFDSLLEENHHSSIEVTLSGISRFERELLLKVSYQMEVNQLHNTKFVNLAQSKAFHQIVSTVFGRINSPVNVHQTNALCLIVTSHSHSSSHGSIINLESGFL